MKKIFFLLLLNFPGVLSYSQHGKPDENQRKAISLLIDQYSEARENSDTVLLKKILTSDIDQLVSNGEWRMGLAAALKGMQRSSAGNPGTRTLRIENIRMFNPSTAIVDCRYEIKNSDGNTRKMWSTFMVVAEKEVWRIAAIRNMLPAVP